MSFLSVFFPYLIVLVGASRDADRFLVPESREGLFSSRYSLCPVVRFRIGVERQEL